ncbi:DUF4304 domain-containing protein [Micromonospora sp. SL4-19]|uniref:DUF4304 domain-containing protein n=1 Tax=Micromonospora sp. SL4-19 TaxID=3399129 RepID=UPI003A4E3D62
MLRLVVAPALRGAGLKGSGTRYRLDGETTWARIGFRSSQYNHADLVEFTVNLCVVGRLAWESARRERPHLPKEPSPNTFYGPLVWNHRIGRLMPSGRDEWWRLDRHSDPDAVGKSVVAALLDHGLPAMRRELARPAPAARAKPAGSSTQAA